LEYETEQNIIAPTCKLKKKVVS